MITLAAISLLIVACISLLIVHALFAITKPVFDLDAFKKAYYESIEAMNHFALSSNEAAKAVRQLGEAARAAFYQ